jgi:hypothetical protein
LAAKQDQNDFDGEVVKSSARKWQSYYCIHVWIFCVCTASVVTAVFGLQILVLWSKGKGHPITGHEGPEGE